MKFGREFTSQMVPEWQDAYMDYNFLKTLLKDVIRFKQQSNPPASHNNPSGGLKRKLTLYRAFSGLISRKPGNHQGLSSPDVEEGDKVPILVKSVNRDDGSRGYKTTFLMAAEDGGEYELVFFRRLDDEFNKVEKFYKEKMEEVMKEAAMLNKQMDALIAFRIKVENPQGWQWQDLSIEMTRFASDIATSAATPAASTPAGARARQTTFMEVIEGGGSSMAERSDEEEEEKEKEEETKNDGALPRRDVRDQVTLPNKRIVVRPAPTEILDHVRINNTFETPRSTIRGVLKVPNHTELKFSTENLRKVEEKLKQAFVEFYQKLRLLKSYSFLNTLALSKIMKKYDKIASRNASKSYMRMVDNSCLGSSDEVTKLMERVEATFIKHFTNGNRSKGINILTPKAKRERHRLTFSTGFSAGCTFSLIMALVMIIRTRKILLEPGQVQYMNTMFPLYSFFGFIVLHMLMYAVDVYFWRRYRINYSFIFGFKQGTELGYRQVLFLSFSLGGFALLCVLGNLDMEIDPGTKDYQALTELLPLFLLVALVVVMILPFNVLYRSGRFFFLTCLFHCVAAPLYKVTLPDFFLGDQLTSQVQAIRSLEFYICYYGWGDFAKRQNKCVDYVVYKTFFVIVAVIPYLWRLLQCLRRLFEEKNIDQGYNGLKYFLTIVAVCWRTAYNFNKVLSWAILAWIFSAIAAIFCTYWDFVHDWGLLNRHSKNKWLRDKLLVPHKEVYFIAMVLNVLLRFAWLQTVLNFSFPFLHQQTTIAIFASLEIIRRGIWNFFRLENEHLNNVGKYRAFKSVPLPFNYDEDDDK